jgi:hypothetical protein
MPVFVVDRASVSPSMALGQRVDVDVERPDDYHEIGER